MNYIMILMLSFLCSLVHASAPKPRITNSFLIMKLYIPQQTLVQLPLLPPLPQVPIANATNAYVAPSPYLVYMPQQAQPQPLKPHLGAYCTVYLHQESAQAMFKPYPHTDCDLGRQSHVHLN